MLFEKCPFEISQFLTHLVRRVNRYPSNNCNGIRIFYVIRYEGSPFLNSDQWVITVIHVRDTFTLSSTKSKLFGRKRRHNRDCRDDGLNSEELHMKQAKTTSRQCSSCYEQCQANV